MIKGCQKRVLWVKNIESECFDGAFFIVSDKSVQRTRSEGSMVDEANRIISKSAITNYFGVEKSNKDNNGSKSAFFRLKWFSLGAAMMLILSIAVRIF